MRRHLFGPVAPGGPAPRRARAAGVCRTFGPDPASADVAVGPGDDWAAVLARLPAGWRPDFVAVALPAPGVPRGVWAAPVPVVGLAVGWSPRWHACRLLFPHCDLVLADPAGAAAARRAGPAPALAANLCGVDDAYLAPTPPGVARDVDVLYVSNLPPAVAAGHQPWVARLARLGGRWRVAVHAGAYGADYRRLLARARVVVNRGLHGECNYRAFEAAAAGCLVFQEAGNREVARHLRPGREAVAYGAADLEGLLDHYLSREGERAALAAAGRRRAGRRRFDDFWARHAARVGARWPELLARAAARAARPPGDAGPLLARAWGYRPGRDPGLPADLRAALAARPDDPALLTALGAVTAGPGPGDAAAHFRRAADLGSAPARLALAEALAAAGRAADAAAEARAAVARLAPADLPPGPWLEDLPFPRGPDVFRVEWEGAAWAHAGSPADEARAKRALLLWRLHALLAEWTGDDAHLYEAAVHRPDLPAARVGVGAAALRAGRPAEAVGHLRAALAAAPLDRAAARLLADALGAAGDAAGRAALAADRRLLSEAAPGLVPPEPWFADPPGGAATPEPAPVVPAAPAAPGVPAAPAGDRPRVSLTMIVRDEEANLARCLASAADLVDEVVVADTGSADRTREVAARFRARVVEAPWADDFGAARNAALAAATGRWVWWLDADDRLTDENRGKARALFAGLGGGPDAYAMTVRSAMNPAGTAVRLLNQVRLFPNRPGVRWRYRVHEQIMPAVRDAGGGMRWADVAIEHGGYRDPAVRRRKLERNHRLLKLEDADRPGDPYTLFNLGWTTLDLGDPAAALPVLRRSLATISPASSVVRKLHLLVAQCHRAAGDPAAALAACRAGLGRFPDDPELGYEEARLLRAAGDPDAAAGRLRTLLATDPGRYLASVDAGLRGYKARHLLADIRAGQGAGAEAEELWRAAAAERPDFAPAWAGLGRLYQAQGRWADVEAAAAALDRHGEPAAGAAVRARGLLARGELAAARAVLEAAVAGHPRDLRLRVLLTHALLRDESDPPAADRALRAVLALDPGNVDARRNLAVLRRRYGPPARPAAAAPEPSGRP